MTKVAARTALATWVAISVLVGATVAGLKLSSVSSERIYESVIDGDDVAAAAIVGICWSLLTFVCGAPLVWAVVALRARVSARKVRRVPARETDGRTGRLLMTNARPGTRAEKQKQ